MRPPYFPQATENAIQSGKRLTVSGQMNSASCISRRFAVQLTDDYCRILAECHPDNGVIRCFTFLDGDDFLNNWGFGEDNCGNPVNPVPKGLINRCGKSIVCPDSGSAIDVFGRCRVTLGGRAYDTICVMDVKCYNKSVVSEQYIDRNGRTILWRRFNRDDWQSKLRGGSWSERLPDNERLTINGQTYVHWYDCLTDKSL